MSWLPFLLKDAMRTGEAACGSLETTEPGLEGRPKAGGVEGSCPGLIGWKKAAEGGMPGVWRGLVAGRALKSGIGGGAAKSSPEVRGFCMREREDTTDPDLVCNGTLEVLPPCDLF